MCPLCQGAGKLLADQNRGEDGTNVTILRMLHEQCEYPKTCTCQHRTTSAINKGQPT